MWTAYYKDGSLLTQYPDNGNENLFSDIVQDNLVGFLVETKNNYRVYVDIKSKFIEVNGKKTIFPEIDTPFRLIYFRRNYVSIVFGSNNKIPKKVFSHVGWQTTTKDGKNKKYVLGLYDNHVEVVL